MRTAVNAEALVMNYLRAKAEIAALVGTRVYTALPDPPTWPLVIVTRFAGSSRDHGWLDRARIQIECWADNGKRPDAVALFDAVRGAMETEDIRGVKTLGTVTGTEEVNALYLPDPVSSRPRYVIDVAVYVHQN